jgi:hypothetical protein
LAPG